MSHPTKLIKIITPIALAISLAACGGGGDSFGDKSGGTSTSGGTTTTLGGSGSSNPDSNIVASSISVLASSRQLASDGSEPITITVSAKDANNIILPGANVVFSVDKDANLEVEQSTGSVHTATLTPGSAENRMLTVTVRSGSQVKQIKVEVVGTTVTIDGPEAIALNKAVPFVFKLKDSSNKPIAFQTIELSSQNGNTIITDSNFQTDSKGEVAFTLTGLSGGTDTLNVKALGVDYTKEVKVSGDDFTLTGNLTDVAVNQSQTVNFLWENNNSAKPNERVTINSTRGNITDMNGVATSTIMTDANGRASFKISSTTAGQTVITVTSSTGLSTSLKGEFVATTPKYLNTQAEPSLIAPNGKSTIVAKIRDDNDNPVKNKTISFRLNDTVNGQLSAATAVTDSLGRASVSYTAGDSSSAKDGVVINTYIQGYSSTTSEDIVKLTVGGNALRLVLGNQNKVASDGVFYKETFGVIVTDSAGNPIKDQKVDFTIIPTHYYKGHMAPTLDNGWKPVITATCPAEDFDHDGNLDENEDENKNNTLEPTHAATVTGTGKTDGEGKVSVEVVYPKSEAEWSRQLLTATIKAAGTEYIEHHSFTLNMSIDDAKLDGIVPNVTYYNEDRDHDGAITDTFNEDANNNGKLDIGEDINKNGKLDLIVSEDLDGNGKIEDLYIGAYGNSSDCTNPN